MKRIIDWKYFPAKFLKALLFCFLILSIRKYLREVKEWAAEGRALQIMHGQCKEPGVGQEQAWHCGGTDGLGKLEQGF